jgi:hypothetical protein
VIEENVFVGNEPGLDIALRIVEEVKKLVATLGDETMRTNAGQKLE